MRKMRLNSMLRIITFILIVFTVSCKSDIDKTQLLQQKTNAKNNVTASKNIPPGLQKLLKAYPDLLDSADENTIYWKDGTAMAYDDGITNKTHDEKLDNPDLEDQMSQEYTIGANWGEPPAENFEPGRIRYEPFFKKMYGNSSSEVTKNLVSIKWVDGTNVVFTSVNGAADSLAEVAEDLIELGDQYMKYLRNIGGTFNWRNIAGTTRLSNHSFGSAIDISTKFSNYWKWQGDLSYRNQIPIEIVEVFEKHGFIWGGKWYHYDTMHFEYRPELLMDGK